MKRAGFTRTECPGCGSTEERKTNKVCPSCLEAIEMVKRHRQNYEELKKEENLGLIEFRAPASWEHPKYRTFRSNQHNEALDPVGETLKEIVEFIGFSKGLTVSYGYMRHAGNSVSFEPFYDIHAKHLNVFDKTNKTGSIHSHNQTLMLPKKLFELFRKLNNDIDFAISETEKGAIEYGKNALLMLNDGNLTLDEFNKK